MSENLHHAPPYRSRFRQLVLLLQSVTLDMLPPHQRRHTEPNESSLQDTSESIRSSTATSDGVMERPPVAVPREAQQIGIIDGADGYEEVRDETSEHLLIVTR